MPSYLFAVVFKHHLYEIRMPLKQNSLTNLLPSPSPNLVYIGRMPFYWGKWCVAAHWQVFNLLWGVPP